MGDIFVTSENLYPNKTIHLPYFFYYYAFQWNQVFPHERLRKKLKNIKIQFQMTLSGDFYVTGL